MVLLYERENAYDGEKETSQRQCYHMAFKQRRKKIPNKPTLHSSDKRPVIDSWPEAGGGVSAHSKRQKQGPAEVVTRLRADRAENSPWSTMCQAEKLDLNKARELAIKKREPARWKDTDRSLRTSTSHQEARVWWKLFQTLKYLLLLETRGISLQLLAMVTTAANGANRGRLPVRHNTNLTPMRSLSWNDPACWKHTAACSLCYPFWF